MLSFRRLTVTAAAVAALGAPAAAQAMPVDKVSPDARYGVPEPAKPTIDRVSPDARYGVPDENTPTYVPITRTEVVDDFSWNDALVGGGAVLLLTAVLGGAAVAIRPRHPAVH